MTLRETFDEEPNMNEKTEPAINWTVLDPPERARVYVFPHRQLNIYNVCKIEIRPSGTHRLETTDGKKFFVRPTWDYIQIDVENWTA